MSSAPNNSFPPAWHYDGDAREYLEDHLFAGLWNQNPNNMTYEEFEEKAIFDFLNYIARNGMGDYDTHWVFKNLLKECPKFWEDFWKED